MYSYPAEAYGSYHFDPYRFVHVASAPSEFAPPNVQVGNNVCWASVFQSMFNGAGHRISQQRIVAEILGAPVDVEANEEMILAVLNRVHRDDDGRRFRARTDRFTPTFGEMMSDLANNYPVVIGTLSHLMVLVHVEWMSTVYGPLVTRALVVDPASGTLRWLDADEWNCKTFLARVRITDIDP